MKVMEWEVYVEKDLVRRSLKVWVESMGVSPDERLNWYFKDGEMVSQMRKIQHIMPDGLTPMFTGPMDIMKEVIEKMAEAYPSKLFVKSTEYENMHYELTKKAAGLQSELREEKGRFERVFEAYMKVTSEGQPIMATLESTDEDLPVVEKLRPRPPADEPKGGGEIESLVESWPWGWRDIVGYLFACAVSAGMAIAIGRAFRWW